MRLIFFLVVLATVSMQGSPFSSLRTGARSIKTIAAKSIHQRTCDDRTIELEGNVDIFLDEKLHMWADKVVIDRTLQRINATADTMVLLQTNGLTILTKSFEFDLTTKRGRAHDVKVHFEQGFISAKMLERLSNGRWILYDLTYTPCERIIPDWSFQAKRGVIHSAYLMRVSGVFFTIKGIPICGIPAFVLPFQKRSQSGLLIPKISYDHEFGFGVKEEFYYQIGSRCDTTLGLAWKDKRGIVFSHEFRFARDPESYTYINAQYAHEINAFIHRDDSIVKGHARRYWIEGNNMQTFTVGGVPLHTLMCLDFGTDKRIGYHFFNQTHEIENSFYNAVEVRCITSSTIWRGLGCMDKTIRNQFSDLDHHEILALVPAYDEQDREEPSGFQQIRDNSMAAKIPHLEINTIYQLWADLIDVRHDFFIDHVFMRQHSSKEVFVKEKLLYQETLIPLEKAKTVRVGYQALMQKRLSWHAVAARMWAAPELQLRTHVKEQHAFLHPMRGELPMLSRGSARFCIPLGSEIALPEACMMNETGSYMHWFQPVLAWDFVPRFDQSNWYQTDSWDTIFTKNEFSVKVRNNWSLGDVAIDSYLRQGYEFNKPEDILPLRRGVEGRHLLPLQVQTDVRYGDMTLSCGQEIDARSGRLLQFSFYTQYARDQAHVFIGLLYQDIRMQKQRELYSDIPLFLHLGLGLPLSASWRLEYDGQFYAKGSSWQAVGSSVRPLLHRAYLEYKGHCWRCMIGFEEKRYRQQGNWRNEHSFVLSIGLDTIGSFAGRLPVPLIG